MLTKSFVSVVAMTWATAVAAQGAPAPDEPAAASPQAQSGAGQQVADEGEILVTAQRRSERLVDVPLSIATASSEELERAGATSIENLTKVTPGIFLERSTWGVSPTVRGIGSTLPTSVGEQTVTMYVDEIYYPFPASNIFDLASVAGVEVLKGPQGTLFGRNATGGAILLRTLDPSDAALTGRFNVAYERFDQVRSNAYLNVPLGEGVAVNGAVAYRRSAGWVRDLRTNELTNGGTSFTARGKLLLQPSGNLSIVLAAVYSELDDPNGNFSRNLRPAPLVVTQGSPIAMDRYHSSFNPQYVRVKTKEYSGRIKLDIAGGTLSSFTAYLDSSLKGLQDSDKSYYVQSILLRADQTYFSQEANFASDESKPLNFVAGAYYFKSTGNLPYSYQNTTPLFFYRFGEHGIAAYLDGTYKFGDLSVFAGIRYSHEKRTTDTGFSAIQSTGTYTRFQSASEGQWTPRVGLRYALGERSNVYASYNQGFKSGRFDRSSRTNPPVGTEVLDAYEIGFKTASRGFSLNAAIFYYDYTDQQVNAFIVNTSGAGTTQLFNVPKSESVGAEIDLSVPLGDNFDLRAAVAYTRARYVEFTNAPIVVVGAPTATTFVNASGNVSGNTMVRAPQWTVSGTARYHTPIGGNSEFELSVSPYYSSRVYFTFNNALSQKPYLTLDATATLTIDERVKLSVFGRNLTDLTYKTGGVQNTLSLEMVGFAMPRTYGVSIGYSF